MRSSESEEWGVFCIIGVLHLSSDPDIKASIFSHLTGSCFLRICAETLAGRGACSAQKLVTFSGIVLLIICETTQLIL